MLREMIIRAWRDPEFRLGLSDEEMADLPENPAGAIELTDDELEMAAGGHAPSAQSYSANSSRNPSSNMSSRNPSSNQSSRNPSSNSARRPSSYSSSRPRPQSASGNPSCSWRCSRSYNSRR